MKSEPDLFAPVEGNTRPLFVAALYAHKCCEDVAGVRPLGR